MTEMLPANRMANLRRRVDRARHFPRNTCPASRHLHSIADALARRRAYPMLQDEPAHCAGSMLSVLESLYKARNQVQLLTDALATLHDVCARMDAEREAARPSEAEYQAAMRLAAKLGRVGGGAR